MNEKKSVIVIGGGIVGISTTIWLQRYGCDVTIVDRQIAKQAASYGNAGVLAASGIIPITVPGLIGKAPKMLLSPLQPLFVRWPYMVRMLPWLGAYLSHCNMDHVKRVGSALVPLVKDTLKYHQELASGTGAEQFVNPDDYNFLYESKAAYEADAMGWQQRREMGYQWDVLEGAAVGEYDNSLVATGGVLVRMGTHGRIPKPGLYVKALTEHALASGAKLVTGEVAEFIEENGRVSGIKTTADQELKADAVVVTTGAWSGALTDKLGLKVPIETERGYHIELINPSIMPRSPTMVAAGKFVMTPMGDRLRLAGVVEFGGLKAKANETALKLLRTRIKDSLPGVSWDDEESWLGHRPAPADSIPLIGELASKPGAYMGFGHHHIGLSGGPRTGQLLAQLISGQKPDIDLGPYSPQRFVVKG